jgi:hypothetical protein
MFRFWVLLVLVFLLAACVPMPTLSPLPTPIAAAPSASPGGTDTAAALPAKDSGRVQGHIVSQPSFWTGKPVTVYACPFQVAANGKDGFFILEPSIHPQAVVNQDGTFQIMNVPPGAYVIVGGPAPEEALAIQEAGIPKVVHVNGGQVLDLGKVELR